MARLNAWYLLLWLTSSSLLAQNSTPASYPNTKVSGLAFMDYAYMLDNSDATKEGQHGFAVRRLFLTTDFNFSEKFSARARLESNSTTTNASGLAIPWLKDLHLVWKDAIGKGHNITFGIFAPPVYTIAEANWGYRSLSATMLDLNKVVTSRDFGMGLTGSITKNKKVRYAIMYANNNAEKGENDVYKRGYAEIQFFPNKKWSAAFDVDYAGYASGVRGVNFYSNVDYSTPKLSAGIEAFNNTFSTASTTNPNRRGISVFAHTTIKPKYELIARIDKLKYDETKIDRTFFLTGVSYSPIPQIQITPNLILSKDVIATNKEDRNTQARLTVYFTM